MKAEQVHSIFIKRYIFAVSLIGLLSSGAFYTLSLALQQSDSTALLVNISGKQRMLTHKIASLSQECHYYSPVGEHYHKETYERTCDNLRAAIKEMSSANILLSSGLVNGKKLELSYEMRDLYFGNDDLKYRVEKYLKKASGLLHSKSDVHADEVLESLTVDADNLYYDLNRAVELYQKEGEQKIETIKKFEIIAYAMTILVLLLEIIFIFQPMATKIRELFTDLEFNRKNLEHEVQARTLKLEQANMKLMHLASHDPLTGLKNRLNMEHELEEIIAHYKHNHIPYAVLMLDIDWFKNINDTYGHDVGDYVLRELANLLQSSVRDYDSVFRAGGEEFVILFNRISEEKALEKSEKIRKTIEEHPFGFNGLMLSVTISGGLYYPSAIKADSVNSIIKMADIALYDAKNSGRNQIVSAVARDKDKAATSAGQPE